MNWLKQKILGLLRAELDAAFRMLRDERDAHKSTKSYCKYISDEYERMKQKNDDLLKIAEHWRSEANTKEKLFCDIVKEIEGAEDLHNLRQTVRLMAYRAENSGIVVAADPDDVPTVIVTDERVV
jgi:predicted transcriptional regulator